MKTHNRIIYHCVLCGNVVHADPDVRPPECCHSEMAKAAAETICEAETEDETATGDYEMWTLAASGVRTKRR